MGRGSEGWREGNRVVEVRERKKREEKRVRRSRRKK